MTLQECIDFIKRFSHRGDTSVTSSDGNITQTIIDSINAARKDIYLKLPRQWMRKAATLSLVNGTTVYTLASDVVEPLFFYYELNGTHTVLKKIDDEADYYKNYYAVNGTRKPPTHYLDMGIDSATSLLKQVGFWPTPDQSITCTYVYYKLMGTEMLTTAALATQILDIPTILHNAVWKGGLYYFLKSFDDPAQTVAKQDFAEALAQSDLLEDIDLDTNKAFIFGDMSVKTV